MILSPHCSSPMMPTREAMSGVDRAWLEMDTPHNPMVVTSILEFDEVTDVEALARTLVEKTLAEPRFRQRVVERDGTWSWVEDDTVHLGYHLKVHRLEGASADRRLRTAIAAELARPLDRALPLWRVVLFARGAGRVTALFRAHHAIADGVAMMQLMLALADGAPARCCAAPVAHEHHHGPLGGVIDRLESINGTLESLAEFVVDDLRHPRKLRSHLDALRRTLRAIGRVALLPNDNPPRLRAPLHGRRAVAWSSDLPLDAVRRLAHAQGVTLNDVFLTALAGAFGRWLRSQDGALPEMQNLRVAVPVNLRAADDASLGNSFGLVLADLPVGLEGWHARLDVVAERMAALKHSPEAKAVLAALAAVGRLPASIEAPLIELIGGKAVAVVSNLPGPREPLRVAGARLANVVFWPPQAGGIGLGLSLLSYAGHVSVGISADTALIANPREILDGFRDEIEAMLASVPAPAQQPAVVRTRPSRTSRTARSATGAHHAQA